MSPLLRQPSFLGLRTLVYPRPPPPVPLDPDQIKPLRRIRPPKIAKSEKGQLFRFYVNNGAGFRKKTSLIPNCGLRAVSSVLFRNSDACLAPTCAIRAPESRLYSPVAENLAPKNDYASVFTKSKGQGTTWCHCICGGGVKVPFSRQPGNSIG